jgi:hypothetical protein
MPRIKDLPLLERPVIGTDTAVVETDGGTFRLPATAFKGEPGLPGLKGDKGDQGETGGPVVMVFPVSALPAYGVTLWAIWLTDPLDWPADLAGSGGASVVLADIDTTLSIQKNGTEVATVTFPAYTATPTFWTDGVPVAWLAGDVLAVVNATGGVSAWAGSFSLRGTTS